MPAKNTTKPDSPASRGGVYRIQDAARIADVSPTTVRVWERNGLVHSHRGSNGYRYFSEADLQRLRRIAHLRKVEGLNIEGIRRALADDDDGKAAPARTSSGATIGPRLRKLRQDAGLTLGQAAELAELSPSFLSALERDQTGVSAQSLHRLTHAYGSTVSTVLRSDTTELVQLTSPGKRQVHTLKGYLAESLIAGQTQLEAAIYTLQPGTEPEPAKAHEGEEMILVMEGELDVRLATGQRFKVRAGESLFYPSTIEHEWDNTGSVPVRFLYVATPPTY
jgi:DNA-binding transcriptional MerR regulator